MSDLLTKIERLGSLLEARKNTGLPKDKLHKIQTNRMRSIIKHAYDNVPFYRRLFRRAGIAPEEISSVNDLRRLPIVTKEMIRDAPSSDILPAGLNPADLEVYQTSGSTGIPLKIFYTVADSMKLGAIGLRTFTENGMRLFHKRARIVHESIFHKRSFLEQFGVLRMYDYSALLEPREIVARLTQLRPHVLEGYSSSITQIAETTRQMGVKSINPELIVTYAEVLDEKSRKLIGSIFGVEPIDQYGAHEARTIAWECPEHAGYHINIDALAIEFLNDGEQVGAGEKGKVVITNFFSHAMPFIRYDLGDLATPIDDDCSCGCHLPLMRSVEGKITDFVVLRSGRLISPHMIKKALGLRQGIKMFKVTQPSYDTLIVSVVQDQTFSERIEKEIRVDLRYILGGEIDLKIEYPEKIDVPLTGKYRVIESLVPRPF